MKTRHATCCNRGYQNAFVFETYDVKYRSIHGNRFLWSWI